MLFVPLLGSNTHICPLRTVDISSPTPMALLDFYSWFLVSLACKSYTYAKSRKMVEIVVHHPKDDSTSEGSLTVDCCSWDGKNSVWACCTATCCWSCAVIWCQLWMWEQTKLGRTLLLALPQPLICCLSVSFVGYCVCGWFVPKVLSVRCRFPVRLGQTRGQLWGKGVHSSTILCDHDGLLGKKSALW